jgi:serine/threonine protein kinase
MKGKNVKKIKDPVSKEEFYIKKLSLSEKKFYERLYGSDITPEFIFYKDENGDDFIKMKSFGMTLAYYIDINEIINLDQIKNIILSLNDKIKKLHDLGIVHVDLHTKNILVDWINKNGSFDNMEVKIIDFDLSRFIDDLCHEDFDDFKTFLPKFNFVDSFISKDSKSLKKKIQYLMDYEYEMWKMDYF